MVPPPAPAARTSTATPADGPEGERPARGPASRGIDTLRRVTDTAAAHDLSDPATDPFAVAEAAAAVIRERTGVERHDVALVLGSGWGQTGDLIGETLATIDNTDVPGFGTAAVAGHTGTMRSVAIGDTGRRALVYGTRTHYYEGRGVRAVVHGVRTAAAAGCRTVVITNGCGGLRPAVGARHPGADPRPHQPHRDLPASRAPTSSTSPTSTRPGCARIAKEIDPPPRRGRLRAVPRAALRDPGRGADGRRPRRRPGRHVDHAGGDRRARRAGSRCSASRWSPTPPPASRRPRSTTRRCSRPAARPPTACGAPARRRRRPDLRPAMGTPLTHRSADLLAAARAWAADDPDAVTRAELDGLADRRGGRRRGRRDRARRRAWPGCSSSAPPGCAARLGGGPNRMNRAVVIRAAAGLTAYLKTLDPEPFVVVGYDARTNSDVFAHDTCAVVVGAGRAGRRCCPTRCRRRCWRSRSGTSARTPASWSPRRTTRRRTTATRSTSATARRSCRRSTRRSPPRSRRSPPVADGRRCPTTAGTPSTTRCSTPTSTTCARSVAAGQPARRHRGAHRRCTASGPRRCARRSSRPASRRRSRWRRQAEPDPMFPTVRSPTPRSRARWMPPSSSPSRPRPTSSSPTTRTPTGAPSRCPAPAGWRMLRGDEVGALLGSHVLSRGAAGGVCPTRPTASSRTRSCRRACSRRCAGRPACATRRR